MQQLVELSVSDADDYFQQEDMEEGQKEAENVEPIKVEYVNHHNKPKKVVF